MAFSGQSWATPRTGCRFFRGERREKTQPFTLMLTAKAHLPNVHVLWDCGLWAEADAPEQTQTSTERTCELSTVGLYLPS